MFSKKLERKDDEMDSEAAFGQWFQALPVYSQRQILSLVDFESLEQICEVSAGNQRFRAEICDNDSFWVQWLDYHWPQHRLVTDAQVQAMGPRSKARYFSTQLSTLDKFDRVLQFDPRVDNLGFIVGTQSVSDQQWSLFNRNQSLTSLRIFLDRDLTVEFIQRLDAFSFLTTLELTENQIDDEQVRFLAQHRTLTTLKLRVNWIGDEGARALAQNHTLTSLDLDFNRIGDEGARALSQNRTLSRLDLYTNQIGDEGAQALAQNRTLTELNVGGNMFGYEGVRALAQNHTLTELNMGHTQIGDDGARSLAQNHTLTSLFLFGNRIGNEGAHALVQNRTLIRLDLRRSQIRDDEKKILLQNSTVPNLLL